MAEEVPVAERLLLIIECPVCLPDIDHFIRRYGLTLASAGIKKHNLKPAPWALHLQLNANWDRLPATPVRESNGRGLVGSPALQDRYYRLENLVTGHRTGFGVNIGFFDGQVAQAFPAIAYRESRQIAITQGNRMTGDRGGGRHRRRLPSTLPVAQAGFDGSPRAIYAAGRQQ